MKKSVAIVLAVLTAVSLLAGCGKKEDSKKITVAASTTPHAEILEQCKDVLKEEGYELVVKTMDDYVVPNTATESGDVDANYFQHQPYLDQFNEENKTHLVSVYKVHYEPYGIYAGTSKTLKDIPDGGKIAVPNDATNEARALMLLDAQGLIKLKDNTNLTATKNDIVENPHNYDIKEMEAALLPTVLDEVSVAVINGNYAISAGLKVANALATEDVKSTAAQTYANIIVVKEGNENNDAVKALVKAIGSDKIRDYINNTYAGAVVPMF
ncbi:MAG: MetQ/NlpA family ABC transporter substrate-binding protein [Clostridia bacterium]|nr:MetQ/NlpA family ABC transporter substrate-binding protein [Clostridia bacterium]